jgi:DNA-binding IclR family transcriptional regulator
VDVAIDQHRAIVPYDRIISYPAHIVSTPRTKSLNRAVELLQAVAARPEGASAAELARVTGLPRSTVTRTLHTLADGGLVEQGERWTLGYELVRLARAADPYRGLIEAARPVLARVRGETDESALLALIRGRPGIEIVLQLDPNRHVGVASWVGVDVPLHASAAGKLALAELADDELDAWLDANPLVRFTEATIADRDAFRAELARVRRNDWAELVDELEDGLTSLAVPVHAADGEPVAAVGISGPTFRLGRARRRQLLEELRAAGTELEETFVSRSARSRSEPRRRGA